MKKTIIAALVLGASACAPARGVNGGDITTGHDNVHVGLTEAEIAAFTEADFEAIERAQMVRR